MEHASHSPGLTLTHIGIGLSVGLVVVVIILVMMRRRFYRISQQMRSGMGNLQAEKARSSIILNAIKDGVVVIDTQNIIRLFNPAATTLTGWSATDAVGLDFHAVFHFTDAAGQAVESTRDPISQALAQATTTRDSNIMLASKKGGRYFISMGVSPVINDQRLSGVVGVFRDISQEKGEEQKRAEFISTASHEMRTPVAAIEGYLALAMNEKVSQVDSKARSYLEKAHSSTQHLGKLFQDLLTSAKAEDGRLVSHPVVIEMGEYLEQLTDSLKFAAEKKGLLVDFTIGASGSPGSGGAVNGKVVRPLYYVHVDPDRMREVITNLFDNAVKYTETGRLSIGLTGNDEVVQFFIRDTGPGIPAEDLPHLFQKFYRVDNSTTRTIGGTGLGLFISRKIVELYHGRIWAESEPKQGSTFYINLPRLSSQRAGELQTSEAADAARASALST